MRRRPAADGQACAKPTADSADVNFIKRVVAGPGDKLSIEDGHVILNGKRQAEPFIAAVRQGADCDFPQESPFPPITTS